MTLDLRLVAALLLALFAALLFCAVSNSWNFRTFAAYTAFALPLAFVAVYGPFQLG